MIDPANMADVHSALLAFVRARLGSAAEYVDPPTPMGRGFDTFIYTFRLNAVEGIETKWTQPLVLRVYSTADQAKKAEREATIQRFTAGLGYPALSPLAIETAEPAFGLPVMIMRRVAGSTVLESITKKPWRARSLLRGMADAHAALHALPTEDCPLPYDRPLVENQLAEVAAHIDELGATHMQEGLRWLDDRKGLVIQEERVLCHNDFHPLNVMVEPTGAMTVIDWSNAALGDRHCDVARTVALIWFAQIAATSRAERILLKAARGFLRGSYYNRYNELLPVDTCRLAYWETLHTFWGWAQLEDVAARAARDEQQTEMARQIPPNTLAAIRERFWALTRAAEFTRDS
jgi:aminoglycoside phosphotransferase (APT) family kinase protein